MVNRYDFFTACQKAAEKLNIGAPKRVLSIMEKFNVTNNKEKHRYEVNLGTDIAYMEYRFQGGTKVLMHTYVPEKYRGKGNAARFIQHVLDDLLKAKSQVMVNCAAVSRFIREHPEYNPVVVRFKPATLANKTKKAKA